MNKLKKDDHQTTANPLPYIYKCSTCSKLFRNANALIEHVEQEHKLIFCKKFTKTGETYINANQQSQNDEAAAGAGDIISEFSSQASSRSTSANALHRPPSQSSLISQSPNLTQQQRAKLYSASAIAIQQSSQQQPNKKNFIGLLPNIEGKTFASLSFILLHFNVNSNFIIVLILINVILYNLHDIRVMFY